MLNKDTAKQVIDSLPNDVSMDDIIHALYVNISFHTVKKRFERARAYRKQMQRRN